MAYLKTPVTVPSGGTGATTLTGVLTGNGTSAFTASPVSQFGTVIGGTSNTVTSVAPPVTIGIPLVSQGAASNPIFGTATVPGGGTGNTTKAAFSVVCGGISTTAPYQAVNPVAVGQVLVSGGTGALPAFSASPALTSITLSSGTALSTYAEGTWTPVVTNITTPPTITYTAQRGNYVKIGKIVFIECLILINTYTAGTGIIQITGLPFSVSNTDTFPVMACAVSNVTYTGTSPYICAQPQSNTTTVQLNRSASAAAGISIVAASFTAGSQITFSGCYMST